MFKKGEGVPYLQDLKSNTGTMFHIRAQVMLKNKNIKSQIELKRKLTFMDMSLDHVITEDNFSSLWHCHLW